MWVQMAVVTSATTCFMFVTTLNKFAYDFPWLGILPTIIVAVTFMIVPGVRMTAPGYWFAMVFVVLTEALTIGVFAVLTESSLLLLGFLMVWVAMTVFLLRHPMRFWGTGRYPGVASNTRQRTRLNSEVYTSVAWSPAVLLFVAWCTVCGTARLWQHVVNAVDASCPYSDVHATAATTSWAVLFALVFVTYIVAQTAFSAQSFEPQEFIPGSFMLFIGTIDVVLLVVWFLWAFVRTVVPTSEVEQITHSRRESPPNNTAT
jgi:hypothetical protein